MRIFFRILLYAVFPLGILLIVVKGLSSFPVIVNCSIKDYTGWDCPGCGGQRAVDAIVQGKFKDAFYYNQLIYIYLSVIAYIYVLFVEYYLLKNKRFMQRYGFSTRFAFLFIVIIFLFFIIRNI
ncbi:DUF2752 domain-containing protein [Myroides sp. 1354]|uniref:DUF2752 domain-containing protein n=1 Tax=unclassified Myroides TaxID=2642485 RepID=UPI00258161A7|nr:DUF2752 domain-containing protein [Myroides sp. R163-1]MDM1056446.1 DUF2752 domain-containing protein [Myroides sp. 1354]MDM1069448.1 DUF2752 domain-containing protein [Myroides sp. 1372]